MSFSSEPKFWFTQKFKISEETIMSDEEIKVEVYKTEDGKNCLVLASVYKNNCSQETTVIIEDDVLEVLEAARREKERQRSRKRRHGLKKIYLGNEDY